MATRCSFHRPCISSSQFDYWLCRSTVSAAVPDANWVSVMGATSGCGIGFYPLSFNERVGLPPS